MDDKNETLQEQGDMPRIIVTVKKSAGNDMVGDCWTTTKIFDWNTPIGQVYETMKKLGGWDIVIPLEQD
jgi:hypothetical protein